MIKFFIFMTLTFQAINSSQEQFDHVVPSCNRQEIQAQQLLFLEELLLIKESANDIEKKLNSIATKVHEQQDNNEKNIKNIQNTLTALEQKTIVESVMSNMITAIEKSNKNAKHLAEQEKRRQHNQAIFKKILHQENSLPQQTPTVLQAPFTQPSTENSKPRLNRAQQKKFKKNNKLNQIEQKETLKQDRTEIIEKLGSPKKKTSDVHDTFNSIPQQHQQLSQEKLAQKQVEQARAWIKKEEKRKHQKEKTLSNRVQLKKSQNASYFCTIL